MVTVLLKDLFYGKKLGDLCLLLPHELRHYMPSKESRSLTPATTNAT